MHVLCWQLQAVAVLPRELSIGVQSRLGHPLQVYPRQQPINDGAAEDIKRTFASNLLVCRSAAFTFCMPGAAFDSFSSNTRCLWCLRFGLDFIVEAEVEASAL